MGGGKNLPLLPAPEVLTRSRLDFKTVLQIEILLHPELVPAFLFSFYFTLYKTETSVKWTPRVGPCLISLLLCDSL